MIFIYPAIVSKNVNRSIVPAVCKLLEQYYLEQIKLSFVHGKLKMVAFYKGKDIPGTIQLESIKIKNKNVIKEDIEHDLRDERNRYEEYTRQIEEITKEIRTQQNELITLKIALGRGVHAAGAKSLVATKEEEALQEEISRLETKRSSLIQMQSTSQRNLAATQKAYYDKEKHTHAIGGKYEAVAMDSISLKPTIETIEVRVRYVGRPIVRLSTGTSTMYGGDEGGTTQSELSARKTVAESEYTTQLMPVGVKVIPYTEKVKGRIEDMLLSDYYSSAFTSFLKWFWRSVGWISFQKALKGLYTLIDRLHFYHRIPVIGGMSLIPSIVKSFIARGIDPSDDSIYRSMFFKGSELDASNFSNKPDQPGHSYYGASMAILAIEDLIPVSLHEEQNNFFDRPEKFRKLFRLGWNSFVVINEEERTFYFMSALEGGAVMNVPFSLMFETLKLGKYEEGLETQGKYKPRKSMKMLGMFRRMKVGQGLVSFKNLLRKKIAIREHVNNLMNKFGIKMLTEEKINKKLEKYSI